MTLDASDPTRLAQALERLFDLTVRHRNERADSDPQLTPSQRLALALLVDEGPLRLGALADRMGTTDPTATRTVDALEDSGLAARAPDPADRRAVLVEATAIGERLLSERRRGFARLLGESLTGLAPNDRRRLIRLLEELNRSLDAIGRARDEAASAR